MTTLARVLAVLALTVTGLVLGPASPAHACSCASLDAERLAARADAVFVGTIEEVTATDDKQAFAYTVAVQQSWTRGVNSEVVVTSSAQPSACGLGKLRSGQSFLFMVDGQRPPYATNSCGGSGPETDRLRASVEAALGQPEAVAPPTPTTASRTRVDDATPANFTRLAAPGAAITLAGLLGLVVVRRLARR